MRFITNANYKDRGMGYASFEDAIMIPFIEGIYPQAQYDSSRVGSFAQYYGPEWLKDMARVKIPKAMSWIQNPINQVLIMRFYPQWVSVLIPWFSKVAQENAILEQEEKRQQEAEAKSLAITTATTDTSPNPSWIPNITTQPLTASDELALRLQSQKEKLVNLSNNLSNLLITYKAGNDPAVMAEIRKLLPQYDVAVSIANMRPDLYGAWASPSDILTKYKVEVEGYPLAPMQVEEAPKEIVKPVEKKKSILPLAAGIALLLVGGMSGDN